MRNIKYILVNEACSKSTACHSCHRFIPHLGHCFVVEAPGFSDSSRDQRTKINDQLLDKLVRLRKQWPNAKILGTSELDITASHNPIRVNPWMNELRKALSDLP